MAEMEKLHADALAEVVAKLKAHGAVAALVPEQVFGPDATAEADGWVRCVIVSPGDTPRAAAGPTKGVRCGAIVEARAENREALQLLLQALSRALHGAVGKTGFALCLAAPERMPTRGPDYVGLQLVFNLTCAGSVQASPAPSAEMRPVASPLERLRRVKAKPE